MPQTSKKTLPSKIARNHHIANLALQGMKSEDIAKQPEINIKGSQVRKVLRDDQCKTIIDNAIRQQIAATKGINREFIKLCFHTDPKIKLDAIKQHQKNIGITPTHTVNQFFQAIYQDNRQLITQDVEALFGLLSGQAAGAADAEDIIDAELLP